MRRMLTKNDVLKVAEQAGVTPEKLLELIVGSDYISVDLDEDNDKVLVELDETNLESVLAEANSVKLITSGAVHSSIEAAIGDAIGGNY